MIKKLLLFAALLITANAFAQCDGVATFTDARDGNVYNQVTIGTQCWMAENLNFGVTVTGPTNQTNNGTIERYCSGCITAPACGTQGDCSTLGGLYQWDEAMQYVTTNGAQGVCPAGWHVPTDVEWQTMEQTLGMTAAQVTITGWRGTTEGDEIKAAGNCGGRTPCGTSGFNGLLGGLRLGSGGSAGNFYTTTNQDIWWTSTQSGTNAWHRSTATTAATLRRTAHTKAHGCSVRCLRNTPAWPLPVQLLEFKAEWSNTEFTTATLSWLTQSETNNERFEVERSSDGINFSYLKSVPGAGSTNEPQAYTTLDESPIKVGTSYYRLKQVDTDGNFTYSNIDVLNAPDGLALVNLYPNPAVNQLNVLLTSSDETQLTVQITNKMGQVVRKEKRYVYPGASNLQFDVSQLATGNYVIEISTLSGLYSVQQQFVSAKN